MDSCAYDAALMSAVGIICALTLLAVLVRPHDTRAWQILAVALLLVGLIVALLSLV